MIKFKTEGLPTMNPIYNLLVILGLIGISGICFGQQNQVLKLEKETQDSTAIHHRKFLPSATINLKTQYLIQNGVGVEVATPFLFSIHTGVGQLSSLYAKSALEFLPQEEDTELKRKEFIQKIEKRICF